MLTLIKPAPRLKTKINLTDELSEIIGLIISKTERFRHIDMNRVLVCTSTNRKNSRGGTYGKLVPLKFMNGSPVQKYRGKDYAIPRVLDSGVEQLYIIYFYIPKFFDLPPFEKLKVIFHELFHISEDFNGDIRRMARVKKAHGFSTKRFNSLFEEDLRAFYDWILNAEAIRFLNMDTNLLRKNFDKIYSRRMKIPKPVLLDDNKGLRRAGFRGSSG